MKLAEEIVADAFVPTWRSLLVKRLTEKGLPQTDVATLLGISQSAVSKHLMGKLGPDPRLSNEPRLLETVRRVADGLHAKTMSSFEALVEAQALIRDFEDRGPICRIHEEEMPSLQGLGCDICIRVGASALRPEQAALQDLRGALRILEATPGLAALVPHVGTNLARALPGATDVSQVAAVPGRLFVMHGAVKVPAAPEFGVSRHMAVVLLSIVRADPAQLACLNLAPDPALLTAARRQGLRVEKVDPAFERAPGELRFARAAAPRGADASAAAPSGVPDVFYHEGAFGVEPQAYVVAGDATSLALRIRGLV